jgi:hypothetical protein
MEVFSRDFEFQFAEDLYSEFFEAGKASHLDLSEFLERLAEDEPENKRGKRVYEESDDEEEEELQDYAEAFKSKVIDYLLAASGEPEKREIAVEYAFGEALEYEAESGHEERVEAEIINMKYDDPVFFNNQWTYQRIFIDNDHDDGTAYNLTMEAMVSSGMDLEIKHDHQFNTPYVTSIDGKGDGAMDPETGKKKYWEFWIIDKDTGNERIGEDAIYQQEVKKNEMIEWRLATEQESGCGGGTTSDPIVLGNDPTVNKSLLPAYMQNALSMRNYNKPVAYSGAS